MGKHLFKKIYYVPVRTMRVCGMQVTAPFQYPFPVWYHERCTPAACDQETGSDFSPTSLAGAIVSFWKGKATVLSHSVQHHDAEAVFQESAGSWIGELSLQPASTCGTEALTWMWYNKRQEPDNHKPGVTIHVQRSSCRAGCLLQKIPHPQGRDAEILCRGWWSHEKRVVFMVASSQTTIWNRLWGVSCLKALLKTMEILVLWY